MPDLFDNQAADASARHRVAFIDAAISAAGRAALNPSTRNLIRSVAQLLTLNGRRTRVKFITAGSVAERAGVQPSAVVTFNVIAIAPIVSPVSAAVAAHEIGHCHSRSLTGLTLESELLAWCWARDHAAIWDQPCDEIARASLLTYVDALRRDRSSQGDIDAILHASSVDEFLASPVRRTLTVTEAARLEGQEFNDRHGRLWCAVGVLCSHDAEAVRMVDNKPSCAACADHLELTAACVVSRRRKRIRALFNEYDLEQVIAHRRAHGRLPWTVA